MLDFDTLEELGLLPRLSFVRAVSEISYTFTDREDTYEVLVTSLDNGKYLVTVPDSLSTNINLRALALFSNQNGAYIINAAEHSVDALTEYMSVLLGFFGIRKYVANAGIEKIARAAKNGQHMSFYEQMDNFPSIEITVGDRLIHVEVPGKSMECKSL